MPLLPVLVAVFLAPPKPIALGLNYPQILALGRERWTARYAKEEGTSTADDTSAQGIYADALAWRTDRLLAGRPAPLRKHLRQYAADLVDVGYAATEGGTMWNTIGAAYYADSEQAFYDTLTHRGGAPKRVVSDVRKAFARLRHAFDARNRDAKNRADGKAALVRVEKDFGLILDDARRLARKDSDTVLEFCRRTAANIDV